jgi:hypothetical protein
MTLDPPSPPPRLAAYVLKLHRDAAPGRGQLYGRVEHLASGTSAEFKSGADLLAWLALHGTRSDALLSSPPPTTLP